MTRITDPAREVRALLLLLRDERLVGLGIRRPVAGAGSVRAATWEETDAMISKLDGIYQRVALVQADACGQGRHADRALFGLGRQASKATGSASPRRKRAG